MGRSGFDRVAIVGVYLAAIVEAAQASLAGAPVVRLHFPMLDITRGFWAYVPLTLIGMSSVAWVLERLAPKISGEKLSSANEFVNAMEDGTPKLFSGHPVPSGQKIFAPESFTEKYRAAVSQGRTELQIDAMLRPHVGEWMRLGGVVVRTSLRHDSILVVLREPGDGIKPEFRVEFRPSWTTHLANVETGEFVYVQAQIVDDCGIELANGELL